MLVALSVIGLALGFALTFMGPWLERERDLEREASFWRGAQAAQADVAELAEGAIDPANLAEASADEVDFTTDAPRLAPAPIDLVLKVERDGGVESLVAVSDALKGGKATLLSAHRPLRLTATEDSDETVRAIVVEALNDRQWTPIVVAPLAANAPPSCAFDIISLTCR
jgi:hypothetical protein